MVVGFSGRVHKLIYADSFLRLFSFYGDSRFSYCYYVFIEQMYRIKCILFCIYLVAELRTHFSEKMLLNYLRRYFRRYPSRAISFVR